MTESESVAIDDRPAVPFDGATHRLDPRVLLLDRVVGTLVAGIVSFALLVALVIPLIASPRSAAMTSLFLGGWLLISSMLLGRSIIWPRVEYRYASYRVDPDGLELRQGVVWRQIVSVPRSRVQHIDVSQGPLERRYGLGTLRLYTAGTEHAQVAVRGLDHARALQIRDHLLPRGEDDAV